MSNRFAARAILFGVAALVGVSLGCGSQPPTGPSTGAPPPPSLPVVLAVLSLTPNTGRSDLATPIRITGTAFKSGAKLTLDGVATDSTFVSDTTLTAVAPPHAAASIDIVVTNPDGQSARLSNGFAYTYPVVALTVSGRTALEAVGDTSQLTATARFTDGSTRDVTGEIYWWLDVPAVAQISSAGILTARSLGATFFYGRYTQSGKESYWNGRVTVTTPGTFIVAGWIREPGVGPLPNASVLNVTTGQSVLTDAEGEYSFMGQTSSHLSVTKAGYEPIEIDATPNGYAGTPMQRVVRLAVGAAPFSSSLATNDMDYLVDSGTHCQPCRLIRVTSTTSGMLRVRVTWADPSSVLNVWVNGQAFLAGSGAREVVVDAPIGGGEVVFYLGKIGSTAAHADGGPGASLPFTITTTVNAGEDMATPMGQSPIISPLREYARLFGHAPTMNIARLRDAGPSLGPLAR